MDSEVYEEKCGMKETEETASLPPTTPFGLLRQNQNMSSWNPLTVGDRRPHLTPGRNGRGGRDGESERGWQRWRPSRRIDGWSDDFLHTPTQMPPPPPPPTLLILLALALQARHTSCTSHTHTPWLGLQLNQKWFVFIGLLRWQVGYHSDGSTCQPAAENSPLTMPNASN